MLCIYFSEIVKFLWDSQNSNSFLFILFVLFHHYWENFSICLHNSTSIYTFCAKVLISLVVSKKLSNATKMCWFTFVSLVTTLSPTKVHKTLYFCLHKYRISEYSHSENPIDTLLVSYDLTIFNYISGNLQADTANIFN